MKEYLDDFVPCLHNILQDDSFLDRSIKLPALHAIGDLCIYTGKPFIEKHLGTSIQLLNLAARASTQTSAYQQDPESQLFLKDLRIEILDNYVTLLMAAESYDSLNYFDGHIESIYDFIEQTMQIEDQLV